MAELTTTGKPAYVTSLSEAFEKYQVQNLIVKFTASWCGPCVACDPVFQALAAENTSEKLQFVKIDSETSEELESFRVVALPTFLWVSKGRAQKGSPYPSENLEEKGRVQGAQMEELKKMVAKVAEEPEDAEDPEDPEDPEVPNVTYLDLSLVN